MRTTARAITRERESYRVDEMRRDLAEAEAMNMSSSEMMRMFIEGFEGLDEIPDIEIREEWEQVFGELKNWDASK